MLSEGIKETQNTRIEKDDETKEEIEMLYSFGVVIFEQTILESDQLIYSISYFEPKQIYDTVIEDKLNGKLIKYQVSKELDEQLNQMFNLNKGEKIVLDEHLFRCMSHSVEYTL